MEPILRFSSTFFFSFRFWYGLVYLRDIEEEMGMFNGRLDAIGMTPLSFHGDFMIDK